MPIYEQAYRRYEARGPLRNVRFWPITREDLRLRLRSRWFAGLLAACFLPLVARSLQIWVVTQYPQAGRVLPIDGRLFGEFLNQQLGWTLLLTTFAGAGLIANDLRTGAILVYLSRPLTRRDYILGKLGVLLGLNLFLTLVPGLLLYVIGLGLAPEQYLKMDLAWIAPAIVLQSAVTALVVSLLSLAVSSLSRNARVAGLGFFGLFAGLEMARTVLRAAFDQNWATLLSLQADIRALGNTMFGVTPRRWEDVPALEAALVLIVVGVACVLLLRSRVRAVEIVR